MLNIKQQAKSGVTDLSYLGSVICLYQIAQGVPNLSGYISLNFNNLAPVLTSYMKFLPKLT